MFRGREDRLEDAKRSAERAIADAKTTGEPNPSTEVHELVGYLQSTKGESVEDGS